MKKIVEWIAPLVLMAFSASCASTTKGSFGNTGLTQNYTTPSKVPEISDEDEEKTYDADDIAEKWDGDEPVATTDKNSDTSSRDPASSKSKSSKATSKTSTKSGPRAQGVGYYDGPGVDVNFVANPPAEYRECDDKPKYQVSVSVYQACIKGRDEAARMAERYAGGWGKIYGYLRGYSWGLYKFTTLNQSDGGELQRGRDAVAAIGMPIPAGFNQGKADAGTQGGIRGESDAIARFVAVLNTGNEPNATVTVPTVSYAGIDSGYTVSGGVVKTAAQLLNEGQAEFGQIPVLQTWDTVFMGDKANWNTTYMGQQLGTYPWQYWFDNGTWAFSHGLWYDAQVGWNTWQVLPIDTKPYYQGLQTYLVKESDSHTFWKTDDVVNLQSIFAEAFMNSYSWYVNYQYSAKFYEYLDMGQQAGEAVGTQIGKRLAFQNGYVQAYNEKYKQSSIQGFGDTFGGQYTTKFNTTFQDYLTHPKLSLVFDKVVGAVNDGILSPGEQFTAEFTVKNLGGVGSPLNITMQGDVTDVVPKTDSINRLVTKKIVATNIAKIDPRLKPRDTANLTLKVNSLSATLNEELKTMIEILGQSLNVNTLEGSGEVTVQVKNIATVATPDIVTGALKVNGVNQSTAHVNFLSPGQTGTLIMPFSNVDPFKILDKNATAKVDITMSGSTLDEKSTAIDPGDVEHLTVKYFNSLANDKGFVPSGTQNDRVPEARTRVEALNRQEISQIGKAPGNPYKKDRMSTVPGKVASEFQNNAQSEGARDDYDKLGIQMWKDRKGVRAGGKRLHYKKMVKSFSKEKLRRRARKS